jgi:hypothetical protein
LRILDGSPWLSVDRQGEQIWESRFEFRPTRDGSAPEFGHRSFATGRLKADIYLTQGK